MSRPLNVSTLSDQEKRSSTHFHFVSSSPQFAVEVGSTSSHPHPIDETPRETYATSGTKANSPPSHTDELESSFSRGIENQSEKRFDRKPLHSIPETAHGLNAESRLEIKSRKRSSSTPIECTSSDFRYLDRTDKNLPSTPNKRGRKPLKLDMKS